MISYFPNVRDILGNLRVSIYDPMERSAPAKIFEILFWLETSKRPLQRRGSEVASTLVLKSVSASTSPKCPFIIIIIIIIILIGILSMQD